MGDKISALPAATSVDGTEIIPIVQLGATKKVTGTILRSPIGAAGGDLTGTYPNPTLASVTTAQTAVGSSTVIPVLTTDAKGRVISLTTVVNPALTTAQIAGLSTNAAAALATTGVAGLSAFAARADHQHARPTFSEIGALGATATAGGDLTGNYPSPSLATIISAQGPIGSSGQIPVISIDSKGRVTSISSVAVGSSAGGTVTSITAGTGLSGGTITESGTISIASVTTAQANVGSSSVVPVISINNQGQITSLTTAALQTLSGIQLTTSAPASLATVASVGVSDFAARSDHQHIFPTASEIGALTTNQIAGIATTTPAALAVSGVVGVSAFAARADHQHAYPTAAQVGALGASAAAGGDLAGNYPNPTFAAITTAQSNAGSASVIPVVSIDAKGRVTSLSTVAFAALTTSQIAGLATTTPASLATSAVAGVSTFAARADHQHLFPTASEVGALGATAAAGGDLAGNYPSPTLAAITTAQSNVGSSSAIPVISIDNKGRVSNLTTVAIAQTATTAITSLTGDVIASGPGAASSSLAAITTAQINAGSSTAVPVLSIDAKGRVTSLSTTSISTTSAFTVSALQTQALTIDATFSQKIIPFNASGSATVTLPSDASASIGIGSELKVMNLSTNPLYLLAGSGATVNSPNGYRAISDQFASATLSKISSNTWITSGMLVAGADVDPYFTDVSLLLHFNGANAGTSFPDNSLNNYTINVTGSATTSTAQFKFGTASLLGASNAYLTVGADNSAWAFGTGDFTIEFWIRPTAFTAQQNLINFSNLASAAFILSTSGTFQYILNSSARITSTAISLNTWYHVAICRVSGSTRMFVNGVVQSTVFSDSTNFLSSGTLWTIANFTSTTNPLIGNMDDLRVTKGVGRYVETFAPPISQFPDV